RPDEPCPPPFGMPGSEPPCRRRSSRVRRLHVPIAGAVAFPSPVSRRLRHALVCHPWFRGSLPVSQGGRRVLVATRLEVSRELAIPVGDCRRREVPLHPVLRQCSKGSSGGTASLRVSARGGPRSLDCRAAGGSSRLGDHEHGGSGYCPSTCMRVSPGHRPGVDVPLHERQLPSPRPVR